jgi:alkylhydroperoxidase/carboxymuconolactone decarboxylase family protein YurZ
MVKEVTVWADACPSHKLKQAQNPHRTVFLMDDMTPPAWPFGSITLSWLVHGSLGRRPWGYAWSRPGLDQKTRNILTLGILAGLGRFPELGIYTNAALASGVTVDELNAVLVHITAYCGTPAGRQSFMAAHETLKAREEKRQNQIECPSRGLVKGYGNPSYA